MNDSAPSRGTMNLAHAAPFALGAVHVRPAVRQIVHDGGSTTLEPRVMQVLVVLASPPGRVVDRQELIERCWDGRIVGDNAINRVVSRLRQLAATVGAGSFHVETIARVGYRLSLPQAEAEEKKEEKAPAHAAAAAAPHDGLPGRVAQRRRGLLLAAASAGVGALGGAGGALLLLRPQRDPAAATTPLAALLLQAREARRYGGAHYNQAIALLHESVRLDPDSADAWGALALTYAQRGPADADPPQRVITWTREAAQRALALAPGHADAGAALVLMQPLFRHWRRYEAGCREGLTRHPGHPALHDALGRVLGHAGRWAAALAEFDHALAADPLQPLVRQRRARALWCSGRVHDAERDIEAALALWPLVPAVWLTCLRLRIGGGRHAAAAALLGNAAARPLEPSPLPYELAAAAVQALQTRHLADTAAVVDALVQARAERRIASFEAAPLLALLGRPDLALDAVEPYYFGGRFGAGVPQEVPPEGAQRSTDFLFEPAMAAARGDPRFAGLTRRLGLDDYWRSAQAWPDGEVRRSA